MEADGKDRHIDKAELASQCDLIPLLISMSLCDIFPEKPLNITKSRNRQGLLEGCSAGTSIRGSDCQKGACESLKGPITLAIDVLFFWGYFQLFLVYLEK